MRFSPTDLVEELRDAARDEVEDLRDGGVVTEEFKMTTWEAADYIEHLATALREIEAGGSDPVITARLALDVERWMVSEPDPKLR